MKLNTKKTKGARTHEGAPAAVLTNEQRLRRSVLAAMLWEDEFYEDGETISARIEQLAANVDPAIVAKLAVEARSEMNLRHVPLLLLTVLAKTGAGKEKLVADTVASVIQRADEITELLAIYWRNGKRPLSAQLKKGLAKAFAKFDAYQLGKYDRAGPVRLRDVLFLVHAKPKAVEQAEMWKKLADNELESPDTWEVALSGGADKRETFERLLNEGRLGYLALLRNLRGMTEAGVDAKLIRQTILARKGGADRVLPFRFVAAAKAAPQFESEIDKAMLAMLGQVPKLTGGSLVIIDVSGSMYGGRMSRRSDMNRALAASALGAIARELAEEPFVYATAGNDGTRVHQTEMVPARRGMALVDAIYGMCKPLGGGGIFLNQVMRYLEPKHAGVDRVIVITDEQDCGGDKDSPLNAPAFGKRNYLINVASHRNGIGYGDWVHLDGFSEQVLRYIAAYEEGFKVGFV